jgi:hypothetical protein
MLEAWEGEVRKLEMDRKSEESQSPQAGDALNRDDE